MSLSSAEGQGHHHKTCTRQFFTKNRDPIDLKIVAVNLLFLAAFFTQMQFSDAETKQPILIDSEFTQPEKLQLRFRPLGKYAATTFTSHIRVPFNYSSLIQLESKMDQRLDQFVMDIDKYHFKVDDADLRTIHSTFQIY
jgi:hypothetical protein